MKIVIPEKHLENMIQYGDEIVMHPDLSLMEECGELISAVAKFENNRIDAWSGRAHIAEEMTHTLISMCLLMKRSGITTDDILNEVSVKDDKAGWDKREYDWS